jgi:hypothetical protein
MLRPRVMLSVIGCFAVLSGAGIAIAKNQHHHDAHTLLGAKLSQDGKHEVGKIGSNSATAEVKGKKVVNMSAGNLPVRKVKSNKKMAKLDRVRLAANGDIQLAQVVETYYGYCFDAGLDEVCYWYPAADVIVTDTWVVYTPL